MKAELAKVGKRSSFGTLNKNGLLPQKLLVAGYDKYSAYDLAWQSYHVTAAAACRGSTPTGGSGPVANAVTVRNIRDKLSCNQIFGRSSYGHFDAEVSIAEKSGKATRNGELVGHFYNYPCGHANNGGSEASTSNNGALQFQFCSFCCCRR